MENFWRNQFISTGESVPQEENILFGASLLEYDLLCLCVYAFATRRHCTQSSYLISSSSSSSSSASIAAEIAARCLPWAQRRQLLIYRDRTTEPLTPASTRSIPPSLSSFSLRLTTLSVSLPIDLSPRRSPSNSFRSGFIVVTVASDAFCPRDLEELPNRFTRRLRQCRNPTRLYVRLTHVLARMWP